MSYRVDVQRPGEGWTQCVEGRLLFATAEEANQFADDLSRGLPPGYCHIKEDFRNATHRYRPDATWWRRAQKL